MKDHKNWLFQLEAGTQCNRRFRTEKRGIKNTGEFLGWAVGIPTLQWSSENLLVSEIATRIQLLRSVSLTTSNSWRATVDCSNLVRQIDDALDSLLHNCGPPQRTTDVQDNMSAILWVAYWKWGLVDILTVLIMSSVLLTCETPTYIH